MCYTIVNTVDITMKPEDVLKSIGLNDKEAHVYTAALECGEQGATGIAKQAKLKRPTTYVILDQLVEKGLITKVQSKGSLLFRPVHPEVLMEMEKRKLNKLQEGLPLLLNIRNTLDLQPEVQVLKGEEAAHIMLEDILRQQAPVYWWGSELLADEVIPEVFESYNKRRKEKGIWSRGITSKSEKAKELSMNQEEELREVRVVPKDLFPMNYNVDIYGDTVCVLSFNLESGILIKNADIAEAHRAMFLFAFEQAQKQ